MARPPAHANAQYVMGASGSPVSSCAACQIGSASSASWSRISSSPGTGSNRVLRSTNARVESAIG